MRASSSSTPPLRRLSYTSLVNLSRTRLWLGVMSTAAGLATLHIGLSRLLAYVLLQPQALVVTSCVPFAMALGVSSMARPDRPRQHLSPGRLGMFTLLSSLGCMVLVSRLYIPGVLELQPVVQIPWPILSLLALLPFVAGGRLLVGPIARNAPMGPRLAAAGFVGVSLASLLAEPLLTGAGTPGTVALSAVFFAFSTASLTRSGRRGQAAVLSFSVAAAAVGLTGFAEFPAARGKGSDQLVRHEQADIAYQRWTPEARIDVLRFDPPRTRGGMAVLGAGRSGRDIPGHYLIARDGDPFAAMYEWDGQLGSLSFLEHHLLHAPYLLFEAPRVLSLQGTGGIDVLAALSARARLIRLSIGNRALREVGDEVFRDFNGDLLHHPQVHPQVIAARALLRETQSYDLISLQWGQHPTALGLGMLELSENQLYTREAIDSYLEHLAPGGVLSISLVDEGQVAQDGEHLRLLRTVRHTLRRRGTKHPAQHICVLASTGAIRLLLLIVRPQPLTEAELNVLQSFAMTEGFSFASAGQVPEVLARQLLPQTLAQAERWPVPTDDTPFFFDLDFFSHMFSSDVVAGLLKPRESPLSLPALLASIWVGIINAILVALWVGMRVLVDHRVPEIVAPLGSLRGTAWLGFFAMQGLAFAFFVLGVVQPLATANGDAAVALGRLLPALSLGCALGCALQPSPKRGFLWAWMRLTIMVVLWLAIREGDPRWFEHLGPDLSSPLLPLVAGFLIGGFLPFGLRMLRRDVRWVPPALSAGLWGLGIGHSMGVLIGARLGFSALPQAALFLCVCSLLLVHAAHRFVIERRRREGAAARQQRRAAWVASHGDDVARGGPP